MSGGGRVAIIREVHIESAQVVESNVPEDDHPEWDAGATYATGDRVIVGAEHLVFESAADANTGNDPMDPTADPPKWVRVRHTNRFEMFRLPLARQTEMAEEIDVTLAPGRINAIAFFGLDAATLELTMTDPEDGVLYQRTLSLNDSTGITNWYAYLTDPIRRRRDLSLWDLPVAGQAELRIRILAPGGTAKCALVVVGMQKPLGLAVYGAQFSVLNYSQMEFDEWGNFVGEQRPWGKRATVEVWCENNRLEDVRSALVEYRSKLAVWSTANGMYEGLSLIYGVYKEVNIVVQYPDESLCNLEVWGAA